MVLCPSDLATTVMELVLGSTPALSRLREHPEPRRRAASARPSHAPRGRRAVASRVAMYTTRAQWSVVVARCLVSEPTSTPRHPRRLTWEKTVLPTQMAVEGA